MSTTKDKIWTYTDYSKLNDNKRYEILEGELIEMSPAPNYFHQTISANLHYELMRFVKSTGIGQVTASPIDVIFDEYNTLQPDIIYISNDNKNIIKEKGVFGSPDLIIEIISRSTATKDREQKFSIYEKFKVKEYWIVDPTNKSIDIFSLVNDHLTLLSSSKEKIRSNLFSKLEINLKEIFI